MSQFAERFGSRSSVLRRHTLVQQHEKHARGREEHGRLAQDRACLVAKHGFGIAHAYDERCDEGLGLRLLQVVALGDKELHQLMQQLEAS